MNLNKVPPNDFEIEKAFLAYLIQRPNCIADIIELVNPDDFYATAHQKIYSKIIELFQRQELVSVTTVTMELRPLISEITAMDELFIPDKQGFNSCLDKLLELSNRRKQIEHSIRAIEEAYAVTKKLHCVTISTISHKIKDWLDSVEGNFSVEQLDKDLNIEKNDKGNRRQILKRYRDANYIERVSDKNNLYRKVNIEENRINWLTADVEHEFPLKMPFSLEAYVKIYPKNIIVVAGASNAGKTAFLLNLVNLNMANHNIYFFSSEMGPEELKVRLSHFKEDTGVPKKLETWKFTAIERSSNFCDVIRPNDLNIIDYLEIYDNFFTIGADIKKIYDKLKNGIAIIAIQKKKNEELGRGSDFTLEKSRLYISLDNQKCKIIKAKNWRTDQNPNNKEINFKLVQGCKFIQY